MAQDYNMTVDSWLLKVEQRLLASDKPDERGAGLRLKAIPENERKALIRMLTTMGADA